MNENKDVIHDRMEKIYKIIGDYIKNDVHIITPLFMHEVVIRHEMPGHYRFWEKYCLNLLKLCDKMIVLRLEGWESSRGIAAEIEFCHNNGIPIEFINYQ